MSNRNNPRRGDSKRTEHGPRWESKDPGKGCNSTHVARGRARYRRALRRAERHAHKADLFHIITANATAIEDETLALVLDFPDLEGQ